MHYVIHPEQVMFRNIHVHMSSYMYVTAIIEKGHEFEKVKKSTRKDLEGEKGKGKK